MYRFYINSIDNEYHFEELARLFFSDDEFEIIPVNLSDMGAIAEGKIRFDASTFVINVPSTDGKELIDSVKRRLYELMASITETRPSWGTLTGVRPLKLAYEQYNNENSIEDVQEILKDRYLISNEKVGILGDIMEYQLSHGIYDYTKSSSMLSIYVGIPFCPTRCEYCAFASNIASDDEIEEYLDKLVAEIEYTGSLARQNNNTDIESIYIGGGTPTTLNPSQLRRLVEAISDNFGIDPSSVEFTVEAGRPDTITEAKLETLKSLGINRISINPQSMKDETLRTIGRRHTASDIRNAYALAKRFDFEVINADLIAGLTGENLEDFKASLEEMIELGANNITVHTLSVKRGSRLRDNDPEYYRRNTEMVARMVEYARERLAEAGFVPYYIYRQKHQMGGLENIGYCKLGLHSLYNIRIMEEKQTIIALGAGAIGKVYYPSEDRLERIANVSNYKIYSERFDEMLERKNGYFV